MIVNVGNTMGAIGRYGIAVENTVVGAILVTVAWFFFAANGHQYLNDSPPRANVIPSQKTEVNGQTVEVPMLDAVDIHKDIQMGNWSDRYMTQRTFDREMEEYRREHKWRGILAALGGVVTFLIGARLGEHWACGLACVFFGPLAVAYTGYRRTRVT